MQFVQPEAVAAMWDLPGAYTAPPETETFRDPVLDLPDDYNRFTDAPTLIEEPYDPYATRPFEPVVDRWASSAGTLSADPGSAGAFVVPTDGSQKHSGGPPAFVLGLMGLFLIAGVALGVAWFVIAPLASDAMQDSAHEAISATLANTTVAPDPASGSITVTEAQIRTALRAHTNQLDPITDPVVKLSTKGFTIDFSVYGYTGTISGDLAMAGGQVKIVDPTLTGMAGRMLDIDAIALDLQDQFNAWLTANNLRVVSIATIDDAITIVTAPAA